MRSQRLVAVLIIVTTAVVVGCGQVRRPASAGSHPRAAAMATPVQPADAPVTYLDVDGDLIAAAPDGAGGWFVGGRFRHARGQPRSGLAHVRADGELDPAWRPRVSGQPRFRRGTAPKEAEVSALSVLNDRVYVGGSFTSVNGRPRRHLAAVSARTGRLLAWNPRPNRTVQALAVARGRLYVGGFFTRMARASRPRLAAFDAASGKLTAWSPAPAGREWSVAEPTISALKVDLGRLYVGGSFTSVAGRKRVGLAAFDIASGALSSWNPGYAYRTEAVAVHGDTVYVAGPFNGVGRYPDQDERISLAAFDARSGRLLPWRADAAFHDNLPDADPSAVYPAHMGGLAVAGDRLYVSGEFDTLAGEQREGVGAVQTMTGALVDWLPRRTDAAYSLPSMDDRVLLGESVR